MFAVIKTGGKQYRVSQGDKLRVETLDAEPGDTITIDQVLMLGEGDSVSIGDPLVSNASVSATVVAQGRGKKIEVVKFRRRKHYRRQMGHRQNYTELEITGISGDGVRLSSSATSSSSAASKSSAAASKPAPAAKSDKKESASGSGTDANVAAAGVAAGGGAAVGALKFLDTPEGTPDDLKKILGIGPVLEEKLNDMGVYHYHQVAAFTDSDIENINTHLNFPGRIERDEWIPQAKELMEGGTGRTLKYLDAPEGEKDDLKLISGVGPVLEDKLNDLGIYHFWQVAKFEARDIDLVNDAMAFPGRIERDEWIDQAKNLADGGEPR